MSKLITEEFLKGIIEESIKEGKLFDLLFTEEGRRLWQTWSGEQMKRFVHSRIKKDKT